MEANGNDVLDHVSVGIIVLDSQGTELLKTPRARDLVEPTLLSDPDRLHRRIASLAQRCRDSGSRVGECFESAAGGPGLRLSASPLSDGRTVITLESMERSEEVEERVRQFVAQVTHDLRTPLTSILGASDLLLSGRVGAPEERHAKLLRIVGEGTQRLASLLNEITARFVDPGTRQ